MFSFAFFYEEVVARLKALSRRGKNFFESGVVVLKGLCHPKKSFSYLWVRQFDLDNDLDWVFQGDSQKWANQIKLKHAILDEFKVPKLSHFGVSYRSVQNKSKKPHLLLTAIGYKYDCDASLGANEHLATTALAGEVVKIIINHRDSKVTFILLLGKNDNVLFKFESGRHYGKQLRDTQQVGAKDFIWFETAEKIHITNKNQTRKIFIKSQPIVADFSTTNFLRLNQ